jgi:hypothetical protein
MLDPASHPLADDAEQEAVAAQPADMREHSLCDAAVNAAVDEVAASSADARVSSFIGVLVGSARSGPGLQLRSTLETAVGDSVVDDAVVDGQATPSALTRKGRVGDGAMGTAAHYAAYREVQVHEVLPSVHLVSAWPG